MSTEQIQAYFAAHRADILRDIMRLVRIPSVKSAAEPNMPYGREAKAALEEMIKLAQEYGFQTQVYDDAVGTADFDATARALDILVHLDVVSAQEPWTIGEPFAPCERDGKLYGRGVADDKGPAIIALYAMRAIKEAGIPLKKGVRLVFGTDEECGSSDLPHYYDKVPEAEMTISPDAEFPVVVGEKGRIAAEIVTNYPVQTSGMHIVSIQAGSALNVLPGTAHAVLENCHFETIVETCAWHETRDQVTFIVTPLPKRRISIQCDGTGAHAAEPKSGNNALTALLDLLAHLPFADCPSTQAVRTLARLFPHRDFRGAALKIAMRDDSFGSLTMSLNTIDMREQRLIAGFDCRTPLCAEQRDLLTELTSIFKTRQFTIQNICYTQAHYVDPDSPFIRTLLSAYERYTGQQALPICVGGSTYVHALKNGVAYGCTMPGKDNHMHGIDECMDIDDILTAGMIYTQAILDLCT